LKDLGSYLKRTRISNGVSLEEAAGDMELSIAQLENIEGGNTRAFKDIYKLKEYIKFYAKYLGLDPDVVMDTFNEFLFEKTSKISLEDIKEAQERAIVKEREEKSKVRSPYTIIRKKKIDVWPIIIWFGIVLVAISIALLLVKNISKEPIRSSELKKGMEEFYEFTY